MKPFHANIKLVSLTLVFLAGFTFSAMAQKTPGQQLRAVYQKLMKVKDYSVDANIKADIPLIRILPVNATIYFKQPDKFKVDSKGIAIMPRQGFSDLSRIIKDTNSYTAVYTGNETIGNLKAIIISLIPSVDTGDLILAKFWIDASRDLVLKSQLTTRSNGTMLIEYFYTTQAALGLPDKMIFTVDVKKFKIPKAMATDIQNVEKPPKGKEKESKKGTVVINLKNYKINQGLKDSFFKQK
jgi:outer membrane lipoprotein-sorting protein